MPSATYFRRQADICVRLSVIASDEELATRLLTKAESYKAKAEALENGLEPMPPEVIGLACPPGGGVDRD